MSLGARIAENPGGFFLAFAVWIPLAVWIVTTVWWMVEGEIDALSGALSLGVALALGYFTADPPAAWMAPLLFAVALVTVAAVPYARTGMRNRAIAALDMDQVRQAYEALEARPDNLGAVIRMAQFLHARGLPGHATVLLDQAVSKLPGAAMQEEQRTLRAWKLNPPRADAFKALPCLRCGRFNEAGRTHCEGCGACFLLDHVERRWLPKGTSLRRILVAWVLSALALVCIPATAASPIPAPVAIVLVVVELAVAGLVLIRSLAGGPSGAQS